MTDCKARFRELVQPTERVLDEDLTSLSSLADAVRVERYNELKSNEEAFLTEFTEACPDFLTSAETDRVRGEFRLARLLIAASFYAEDALPRAMADEFTEAELRAVVDFDRYRVFDTLSAEELEARIRRMEGEVYELVADYSSTQLADIDALLEEPDVQTDVMRQLLDRYQERRERIEEGLIVYLRTHGPEHMVETIESAVLAVADAADERESVRASLESLSSPDPAGDLAEDQRTVEAQLQAPAAGDTELDELTASADRLADAHRERLDELEDRLEEIDALDARLEAATERLTEARDDATERLPAGTTDGTASVIDDELDRVAEQVARADAQAAQLERERRRHATAADRLDERRTVLGHDDRPLDGDHLVTAAMARLMELDYIGRVDTSFEEAETVHTPDGPVEIPEGYWAKRSEHRNERARLETRLDEGADPDRFPLNRATRYIVSDSRWLGLGTDRQLVLEAAVHSNLEAHARHGFDADAADVDDLLTIANRVIAEAEQGDYHHCLAIASPTGWTEAARGLFADDGPSRTRLSPAVSLLLVDLRDGSVVHDPTDVVADENRELFEHAVDDDRVAACLETLRTAFVDEPLVDSIRLETVTADHGYQPHIVKRAFEQLEADGVGEQLWLDDDLLFEIDLASKPDPEPDPGPATPDSPNPSIADVDQPPAVTFGAAVGSAENARVGTMLEATTGPVETGGETLAVPAAFVPLMELRTESTFRPDATDVETIYALSGATTGLVDRFHSLASDAVIAEATPTAVVRYRDELLEQVLATREEPPAVLVDIHTHPGGSPQPSDLDLAAEREVGDAIGERLPGTTVVFGIHAVSEEADRDRRPVERVDDHRLRWQSERRAHEVGFYTAGGEPTPVDVLGDTNDVVGFGQTCPSCHQPKDPAEIQYWPDGEWSCVGCAQERTQAAGLGPDEVHYGSDQVECPQCGEPKDLGSVQLWDDGQVSCIECAEARTAAAGLGPDPADRYGQGATCPSCGETKSPGHIQAWEDGQVSCIGCAQERTQDMGLGPDDVYRWGLKLACPTCGESASPAETMVWDDGVQSCLSCAESRLDEAG